MIYDGLRFRAAGRMAGKLYGQPFGVDVGFGDPMLGAPEVVTAEDVLGFAGIAPPTLRIYPIETHIAEKLHAYTLPRKRPNSRVKDLPDLALLASAQPSTPSACGQRSSRPSVSARPMRCPLPCRTAGHMGSALRSDGARGPAHWPTLAEVTAAARAFLDPVLAGVLDASWNPTLDLAPTLRTLASVRFVREKREALSLDRIATVWRYGQRRWGTRSREGWSSYRT